MGPKGKDKKEEMSEAPSTLSGKKFFYIIMIINLYVIHKTPFLEIRYIFIFIKPQNNCECQLDFTIMIHITG